MKTALFANLLPLVKRLVGVLVPSKVRNRLIAWSLLPYSGKIWRALNLVKWRKEVVFWYWWNLNLAIWNCTCDVIILRCDVIVAHDATYASSPKLRMETLEVDRRQLCSRLPCFWKYLEPNHKDLNCVRERTNTEDPYAVGVIRRNAVVGHVPRKMSAACALFLRWRGAIWHDQLRLVLLNTQVQS